jgi:N-acetyl-gamma-glutamyl-phosphate reductase
MKIGVIGATGYTGMALLSVLAGRPKTRVTLATSRGEAGRSLAQYHPSLAGAPSLSDLVFRDPGDLDALRDQDPDNFPDLFFLAVTHGVSMGLAPALLERGAKVIDLTGDFRLKDPALYPKWYKKDHSAPLWLGKAVYGLPELHRREIAKASLVANPGCYPTSVILALAPLARAGLLSEDFHPIADSKSGVSGAGRGGGVALSYAEVAENFRAYKVVGHQHAPEMAQELSLLAGRPLKVAFTPHLVPMNRGILTTVYAKTESEMSHARLLGLYREFYADEPFVRLLEEGVSPETVDARGTNFCLISFFHDPETGLWKIIAAIDNLARGAVTQAVVNLNIMTGEDETMGIPMVGLRP